MFGTYRTFLALIIVLIHYANVLPYIGHYAVYGFFTLSGFLMTLVMQRNYGYTARGIAGYGINRLLRIYPLYWTACIVSIGILLFLDPQYTTKFNPTYELPETSKQWIKNILLILKFREGPALISPAWALTVEVFFYVCIGFGVSRNKTITAVWLAASAIYAGYMYFGGVSFGHRYSSLVAASLPFSIGASVYFWRAELKEMLGVVVEGRYAPLLWLGAALLNWKIASMLSGVITWGFYLNCLFCAFITLSFYYQKKLFFISRKADSWLGDLSYPIYLVHYPLGFLLLYCYQQLGWGFFRPELAVFWISLPAVFLVSWLMAVGVEKHVEKLRARIKAAI
jgi:peptidoglycan/LPS O-acetylase OafA/YrhL